MRPPGQAPAIMPRMFEIFSDAARQIVVHSQEVSRERGDGFIAPEHFLVALAADTQGIAGAALERVGVTPQGALDAIGRRLRPGGRQGDAIPFTPEAKRTLEMALRMRLELRDEELDPEHLLLSLARTDVEVDYGLLEAVGASAEAICEAVAGVRPEAAAAVAALRPFRRPRASSPLRDPRARLPPLADLDLAGLRSGPGTRLDSGHVLIALAAAPDSVAAGALRALAVDLPALEAAVERVRAGTGPR